MAEGFRKYIETPTKIPVASQLVISQKYFINLKNGYDKGNFRADKEHVSTQIDTTPNGYFGSQPLYTVHKFERKTTIGF